MNFLRTSKIPHSSICAVVTTSTALSTFSDESHGTKQSQQQQLNHKSQSDTYFLHLLSLPSIPTKRSIVLCEQNQDHEFFGGARTTPTSTSNILRNKSTKKSKVKSASVESEIQLEEPTQKQIFRSQSFEPHQSMRKGALADFSSVRSFTTNGMEVGVCTAQNFRPYQEDSWLVLGDMIQKPSMPLNEDDNAVVYHGGKRHWLSELMLKTNSDTEKPHLENSNKAGGNRKSTPPNKKVSADTGNDDAYCSSRDLAVFATFDGHGGDSCSKFATKNFQNIWERKLPSTINIAKTMEETLVEIDRLYMANYDPNISGNADYFEPLPQYPQPAVPLKKHKRRLTRTAGSTAITVAVDTNNETLTTSNVGDSRAILVHRYENRTRSIPLSSDHSPALRPDEVLRIEALGGMVTGLARKQTGKAMALMPTTCPRIYHGDTGVGGLNMTRALGDDYLKPLVIPEPETTVTPMVAGNSGGPAAGKLCGCYLVLASDGVWDVLSNRETADLVLMLHDALLKNREGIDDDSTSLSALSQSSLSLSEEVVRRSALLITQTAQRKGSSDNITCMVVKLNPKEIKELENKNKPGSVFSRISSRL